MTGEVVYDVAGPEPPGPDGPPPRRRRWVLAAAVGVLAVVGAAVAVRAGSLPAPTPPPRAPVLSSTGYGPVELGMGLSDFQRAVCGESCDAEQVAVSSRDPVEACTHFVWVPEGEPVDGRLHWAWVAHVEVAAVGVVATGPDLTLLTDAGHRAGDPLDAADSRWQDWESETRSGREILRRERDGTVRTLADLDGDGRLDYASVATPEGELCTPSPRGIGSFLLPAGGRPIDGTTLSGLALGTPEDEIGSDWTDTGRGSGECRVLTRPQVTVPSVPETAYVRDGQVVGLRSHGVRDGPTAGQPVGEALAGLDVQARAADLGVPSRTALRLWRPSLGEVVATDASGGRIVLHTAAAVGYVNGLDWPAWDPTDGHASTAVVTAVSVGQPC